MGVNNRPIRSAKRLENCSATTLHTQVIVTNGRWKIIGGKQSQSQLINRHANGHVERGHTHTHTPTIVLNDLAVDWLWVADKWSGCFAFRFFFSLGWGAILRQGQISFLLQGGCWEVEQLSRGYRLVCTESKCNFLGITIITCREIFLVENCSKVENKPLG